VRLPLKLSRKVRITRGYVPGQLAARADSVFVADDRTDILCIDANTSRTVWKVPAEGSDIASLVGEVLLATTWRSARGISAESGRSLYVLNATRLRLWQSRWMSINSDGLTLIDAVTGGVLETRAPFPIAPSDLGLTRIDGEVMLYQAEENTQVVAYDLWRQQLLWKRSLRREIADRFGCDVGVVVLRPLECNVFLAHVTSRIVVGCSLADGAILWDMAVPFDSPVVPHRDRIYVMLAQEGSESSPRLVCLDAGTGARVYDVVQSELHGMDLASYGTVHGDYIGFGTRGGLVGLFRLADGGLAWSYRYKRRLYAPVMTDQRLYVCADDGNLLIFEAV